MTKIETQNSLKKQEIVNETLRNLLTLSVEERNMILSEHCKIIESEFNSNSDEMEWATEYIEEDSDWNE